MWTIAVGSWVGLEMAMSKDDTSKALSEACFASIDARLPNRGAHHNCTPRHVVERIDEAYEKGRGLCETAPDQEFCEFWGIPAPGT